MTPPLTDAQVAALATGNWGTDSEEAMWWPSPWTGGDDTAVVEAVQALALEVQQSRQRRCGNCRFFEPWRKGGETGCCDRTPSPVTAGISATWSCADFTPKAPTTEGVTP